MNRSTKTTLTSSFLALSLLASPLASATEEEAKTGAEVYKESCAVCHVSEGKPTIAPPIFAVKNHVIDAFPVRDDFVEQVKTWVKAPDEKKALMRGAIRKFGLMPPMAHLSDRDVQAVAEYLFDTDMNLPDWYAEHYKEEHGEMPKEKAKVKAEKKKEVEAEKKEKPAE